MTTFLKLRELVHSTNMVLGTSVGQGLSVKTFWWTSKFKPLLLHIQRYRSVSIKSLHSSHNGIRECGLNPFLKFELPRRHRLNGDFCASARNRAMSDGGPNSVLETAERPLSVETEKSTLEGFMFSAEIRCPGTSADSFVEALLCFGASSCSIDDANLGKTSEQEIYSSGPIPWEEGPRQLWHESRIRALFLAKEDISAAVATAAQVAGLPAPPKFSVSQVADQDWVQQVQDMYEPVHVAEGLWVLPHWCTLPEPGALTVVLDPGLAFGTGEHPTTRLCLRLLRAVVLGGERVLDYGCGSGVLSIAALKLGAARAVGVDIDPLAVRSTAHNAFLNDFDLSSLQVFVAIPNGPDPVPRGAAREQVPDGSSSLEDSSSATVELLGEYDIVVANILVNPLVDMVERIAGHARPGGWVGLSGILLEQVERVSATYGKYLEDMTVSDEDGWACIQGRRRHPET